MASRVPLLPVAEAEVLAGKAGLDPAWGRINAFRVLLHHPPVAAAIARTLIFLLYRSKVLDRRLRELIIMRIGWRTGADYEWTQHWRIALELGIPEADVLGVRDWQAHGAFGPADRAVLAATDDVLAHGMISDESWAMWTATAPSVEATVEMVAAIGNWRLFSELLHNLDIPLEDGLASWPPDGSAPGTARQVRMDGRIARGGRVPPLRPDETAKRLAAQGMKEAMADRAVWCVLMQHPALAAVISSQLDSLLWNGTLPARLRELLIMRIGWTTGSCYEWTRHWSIATDAGLSPTDLVAVRQWRGGDFDATERAVLTATDETVQQGRISDATWRELEERLPLTDRIELVAAISNWNLFSHLLRSLDVPIEPGIPAWPPDGRAPFG